MKNFASWRIGYFLSVTFLLVSACVPVQAITELPKMISPTNKPVATETMSTPTVTPTGTPTITSTPTITLTPLPTLSKEDAYSFMMDLLKDNGGCRLPCWWGITPGETTWEDAQRFLQTFTNIVGIRDGANNGFFVADIHVPVPEGGGTLNHSYGIKNGTVYSIETYNFDWAPSLTLSNILTGYGLPDEVFISTFRNGLSVDTPYESWPYMIDLFYADQGIWMEYSRGPDAVGETLRNCFEDIDSPFINLWSPDEKMTSSEAIDHFFDTQNLAYPIPLEEATGMTVDTFYDKFKNPNKNNCLETPMSLWPIY